MINLKARLQGEYNVKVKRGDGTVEETGWFKNLILNQGLDQLGSNNQLVIAYAQVGSGTTAPTTTNTQLETYVESSGYKGSANSITNASSPDYEIELTWEFVFTQGSVVATIAEVGVGWDNTAGANLFSRALILDGMGNPTTISVTAVDELIVFYRLRIFPPVSDVTGTVNISGTDYDYTIRPAQVESWGAIFSFIISDYFSKITGSAAAYEPGVTLGAITSSLSGTTTPSPSATSSTDAGYTTGTYYRDGTYTWDPTAGNGTGGFQGIEFVWGAVYSSWRFQMVFDNPIPKGNTDQFSIVLRFSWARV